MEKQWCIKIKDYVQSQSVGPDQLPGSRGVSQFEEGKGDFMELMSLNVDRMRLRAKLVADGRLVSDVVVSFENYTGGFSREPDGNYTFMISVCPAIPDEYREFLPSRLRIIFLELAN